MPSPPCACPPRLAQTLHTKHLQSFQFCFVVAAVAVDVLGPRSLHSLQVCCVCTTVLLWVSFCFCSSAPQNVLNDSQKSKHTNQKFKKEKKKKAKREMIHRVEEKHAAIINLITELLQKYTKPTLIRDNCCVLIQGRNLQRWNLAITFWRIPIFNPTDSLRFFLVLKHYIKISSAIAIARQVIIPNKICPLFWLSHFGLCILWRLQPLTQDIVFCECKWRMIILIYYNCNSQMHNVLCRVSSKCLLIMFPVVIRGTTLVMIIMIWSWSVSDSSNPVCVHALCFLFLASHRLRVSGREGWRFTVRPEYSHLSFILQSETAVHGVVFKDATIKRRCSS